jgi:ABC-2 type transport system ATP-binding protein
VELMLVLETHGLKKRYGNLEAVQNLHLQVPKGAVYGILGPNGSGKTTTLGMLLGIIGITEGSFTWLQLGDTEEARKRIGAILETPNFYPYLSAVDNLKIVCDIKGVRYERIEAVLRRVGLFERRKDAFRKYSLGMKQRLAIASALLNDPEVLILDEPTNGLDPVGISEVRELILSVAAEGKTILLASHLLDEVEKVCSHVAVLRKGELLFSGPVSKLFSGFGVMELAAENMEALKHALSEMPECEKIEMSVKVLLMTLKAELSTDTLSRRLAEKGIFLQHLNYRRSNLEKQFIDLISNHGTTA